ncbi:MAG: hypothetical protein PHT48_02080 [Dechloromonas sp.]|nr:hypothetical protein [Dechloromonas sp.]
MSPLRHLLLVVVLLLAQLAGAAHALEHAVSKEGVAPTHVCELCMVAHDLSAALPSLAIQPAILAGRRPWILAQPSGRLALPAPQPAQRGPPIC